MHNSGNLSPVTGMGGGGNSNNNTYGMTPEQASREFDSLRREATKLERHLEDRVARYQQHRVFGEAIPWKALFFGCTFLLGYASASA